MSSGALPDHETPVLQAGAEVSGVYTMISPRWRHARNGNPYLFFSVRLGIHELPVYAWANECDGCSGALGLGTVHLLGEIEAFAGRYQIRCKRLAPASPPSDAKQWQKTRMRAIYDWMQPDVLRAFLFVVFSDLTFRQRFMTTPASRRHHHAWSGGLAFHSTEVAWDLFQQPWSSTAERGLATVAGLLHDAGKTATLTAPGDYTAVGQVLSHDDVTLEVLAYPLQWLDTQWPDAAAILRALLASNAQSHHPNRHMADAVRLADRYSANLQVPAKRRAPDLIPNGFAI